MTIEWDESLETGHAVIDAHHQELFRRVNRLVVACAEGRGDAFVIDTLLYLVEYTRQHFAAEEAEMRQSGYPALEQHRREHELFFDSVASLQDEVEQTGARPSLVGIVDRMVVDWLLEHVKVADRALAEWLRTAQA